MLGRAIAIALVVSGAGFARADNVAIAVGEPSPAARELLQRLAARGTVVDAEVLSARLERAISSPAVRLSSSEAQELKDQLERGYQHWLAGEADEAVGLLRSASERVAAAPVSVLGDPVLRGALYRARVVLALATARAGDEASGQALMRELARSDPDRPPDRQSFGPAAEQMFARALAELEAQGKGTLEVRAGSEVDVFINERFAGRERLSALLFAGRYRLYARDRRGRGRLRELRIEPGKTARVELDAEVDALVHTGPGWVGLQRGPRPSRQAMARVARAIGAARLIAVESQGDSLAIWWCDDSGATVGEARAQRPSPARLDELASRALEQGVVASSADGGSSLWKPLSLMGAGALVAGAGVALVVVDGRSKCTGGAATCESVYQTATVGWALAGGGAALMGAAAVWLLWPRSKASASEAAVIAPGPGGLVVRGTF